MRTAPPGPIARSRKPTFDAKDPACASGVVSNATSIALGPFDIQWSIAGDDVGYVYYPTPYRCVKMPWGKYVSYQVFGGLKMAMITERDLAKVDAKDPRWNFQSN
jgi:hypothetical protein